MTFIHAPFYDNYVNSVQQPISKALQEQESRITKLLGGLDTQQLSIKYAPKKWSLKDLLLHCLDVERIMAIRILMISRGEQNALLGFSENDYVANTVSDFITLKQIQDDFQYLRKSNISLFDMLPEYAADKIGSVDHKPMSVKSLWYIIVGHWNHHLKIINERYLY